MEIRKRNERKIVHNENNDSVTTNKRSYVIDNAFTISLVIRTSAVLFTQSYFVPDEYWQSTEIAHNNVYGNGYISWEWREMIRSYLYPFIFEVYFQILKYLQLDLRYFVCYGPHIIQSVFSSIGDMALLRFSNQLFKNNNKVIEYIFFLQMVSWFLYYTCSRTLSDTMAMSLVSIALSYLKVNNLNEESSSINNGLDLSQFFFFVGLSCIIRPHIAVLWCVLIVLFLWQKKVGFSNVFFTALKIVPVILLLQFGIDYYYYQQWTFSHWNFLSFNVIKKGNMLFGTHPIHWYFTQGLPVVLGIHLLVLPFGCIKFQEKSFLYSVLFYVLALSLIPHKEFRFLLPSIPFLMPYCGYGLYKIVDHIGFAMKSFILVIFVTVNISAAAFFCMIHQRGSIDLIHYFGDVSSTDSNSSMLFLMPCHSTPYYSYVHNDVNMRFLTCHPSFEKDYTSEADLFFDNPKKWLEENNDVLSSYTYVASYDNLKEIEYQLYKVGFKKVRTFFHTFLPEGRIGNYINVFQRVS